MKTEESLIKIGTDLKAEALAYPEQAQSLVVTNDRELEVANEFVKSGNALIKEIRAGYDDIISNAHATWKGAIAKRDHYLGPVSESVKMVKNEKMAPYMEKQAQIQREAEEALRRAEEEIAEKKRQAEEERQRRARIALHDGDVKATRDILAEPIPEFMPELVVVPETMKLKGTHTQRIWTYKVIDINLVPRSLLMLDNSAVNEIVKEQKEKAKIPGIYVFQKISVSTKK